MVAAHPAVLRPQLIQFNRCKDVRMEGIHVKESPFWTIHLFMCDGVAIRNIDVCAHGFNNDGVGIEMTRNVRLENVKAKIVKQVAALSTSTLYQWAAFPDYETRITEIDGLSVRNVTCEACEECAFALRGDKRLPAKNVVLENVDVGRTQGRLFDIENVENVKIDNVTCGGIGEVKYEFDGGRPKDGRP